MVGHSNMNGIKQLDLKYTLELVWLWVNVFEFSVENQSVMLANTQTAYFHHTGKNEQHKLT